LQIILFLYHITSLQKFAQIFAEKERNLACTINVIYLFDNLKVI